jgi:chromosome segregation and condensation protein ScpB
MTEARRKDKDQPTLLDTELEHLPPELRWREWMGRVEAVIFAASEPVPREMLVRIVGRNCNLDLIIDDIRAELAGRPYELVSVAGGWQHRTKKAFADAIRAATGQVDMARPLSQSEVLVLMCIAYFQPITRGELTAFFGKEVSRDLIGVLRSHDDAGRALHLRYHQDVPVAVRPRYAARFARLRSARRCRAAQQGAVACRKCCPGTWRSRRGRPIRGLTACLP